MNNDKLNNDEDLGIIEVDDDEEENGEYQWINTIEKLSYLPLINKHSKSSNYYQH